MSDSHAESQLEPEVFASVLAEISEKLSRAQGPQSGAIWDCFRGDEMPRLTHGKKENGKKENGKKENGKKEK